MFKMLKKQATGHWVNDLRNLNMIIFIFLSICWHFYKNNSIFATRLLIRRVRFKTSVYHWYSKGVY